MHSLPQQILSHARALPEGGVVCARQFLHLGSRAAVDQALSRLMRSGALLRVARGLYVAPVAGRFGARAPAPEAVVAALATQVGEVVVPHGAAAANALGLTQQVPVREVYVTGGRSRTLQVGRAAVELRHTPRWMVALGARPAGTAVRALAWMGPEHVAASLKLLRGRLAREEWEALQAGRAALPSWLARALGAEAAHH